MVLSEESPGVQIWRVGINRIYGAIEQVNVKRECISWAVCKKNSKVALKVDPRAAYYSSQAKKQQQQLAKNQGYDL